VSHSIPESVTQTEDFRVSDPIDETDPTVLPLVAPEEIRHAKTVLRIVKGEEIPEYVILDLPARPLPWSSLANRLKNVKTIGKRPESLKRWIDNLTTDPKQQADMRRALQLAEQEPPDAPATTDETPAFSLGLIPTAEFFSQEYPIRYLVKGVLAEKENTFFGGPQKTLKTSILLDLAISMASQTPFLGRFSIPEPVRVGLISVETGRAVIQANAKQICDERDLPYDRVANIHWGFIAPKLSCDEHVAVLKKTIGDLGLRAILLDPLYLMLVTGSAGIDPKDMFQMGPMLADVAAACLDAGATPTFCHHFVKNREADSYAAPELAEFAYAGIGQVMRQWMMVKRRQRYDAERGLHALHFTYGGSMGHSGELHLDIETGRIDENLQGRRWSVSAMNPSEGMSVKQDQSKMQKAMRDAETEQRKEKSNLLRTQRHADALLLAMRMSGGYGTIGELRLKTHPTMNSDHCKAAMFFLERSNLVEPAKLQAPNRSSSRTVDGYRVIDLPGSQKVLDLNPE
jgi:hypothetical protein